MPKHLLFFIFVSFLSFAPVFAQVPGTAKIILSPAMIVNESGHGDATLLVDEQTIAGDPLSGTGGHPETLWVPGWGDAQYNASAYIDLGKAYFLDHVFLYDFNGIGDFVVETGGPGNWVPAFTDDLVGYKVWKRHDVAITARYLRVTRANGSSNVNEIVLYGRATDANNPPILEAVGNYSMEEGESLSMGLSATDVDGDSLAFSFQSTASFLSLTDHGDGTAELLAGPENTPGEYEITVKVSDPKEGRDSTAFVLTVLGQGSPLQVIGIDFDNWKRNTPAGWNNTNGFGIGDTIDNLQDQQGQPTGYSMEITAAFNGSGMGGLSTGDDSGPVPDAVMATFWYKQNGTAALKLTLDNTKRYRFRFYGGRDGNNDDKSSDYSIGDATVTLYNWNNVHNEAVIDNVFPDANNEVTVSVKNSPGYTYAILNAITIEEYLEGSPPVIATVADQTVAVGNVLSIPLSAKDADGDSVAFSVSGAGFISLAGLSDTTAIIQVSPEEGDEGAYNIQVSVSDGKGGEDSTTFLLTVVPNEGEISDSIEYQALVDLYNSTNGDGWTNSTNWLQGNTSADFAAWHGITVRDGDVVQIALPNNSLRGGLPNSIGKLTKLENLYLSYNKINSLPSNMGNLTWLFSLRLENNELTSLPPTIGNLNFLFEIDLRHNKLNFLPSEIGGLSNLLFLDLDDNNLASLPNSIGNLSNLFRLEVRFNKLDSLPRQIGNLINLESLYLAFNKLRSLPQEIGNLSALRYLYAHDNQLVELPSTIGNLSNLENLYIDGNELTRLPSTMGNLYSLKEIGLWNNLVTELPSELSDLSVYELRWIHAENNRLGMKSIEQFFSGPNTHKLSAFTFSPQSPPPLETIAATQYSTLTLNSDDNAPHNRYQWQREMNGTWMDIVGATVADYTIQSVTEEEKYRCKITNDWVTGMTLYSRIIHVEVEERLMPTPPVDMVRNRPVDGMP